NCNNINFLATTSNVTNLSWTFGDGNNAGNVANPSHAFLAAGWYTVQLCGDVPSTPGPGTCPVCTTLALPIPLASDFSFVINCGVVTFTDLSTFLPPDSITGWSWSFPGGSPSSSGGMLKDP